MCSATLVFALTRVIDVYVALTNTMAAYACPEVSENPCSLTLAPRKEYIYMLQLTYARQRQAYIYAWH